MDGSNFHERPIKDKRLAYVSNILQQEAYKQQVKSHHNKLLKRFNPCAKGCIFTANMNTDIPVMEIIRIASLTICNCHNNLNETDLLQIYYDTVDNIPS